MRDSWYSLLFRLQAALTPARLRHGIKTALAAGICQAASALLGLEYGYWSVLTAIIVMQMDLGNSLKASANRLLGTMTGAVAAVALGLLAPPDPAWREVGLLGLVGVCACLAQVHESFRMAAITAVIAILGWNGQESLLLFSLARTVEIFLGVGVAVAVSALVWPARASGLLRVALGKELRNLARLLDEAGKAFVGLIPASPPGRMEQLQAELARNRALWQSARREPSLVGREIDFMPLIQGLDRLFEEVRVMRRQVRVQGDQAYRQSLAGEVTGLSRAASRLMERLARELEPQGQARDDKTRADKTGDDQARDDKTGDDQAALDLDQALAGLDRRFLELRTQDATKAHPLESIMASFAFCQALKNLASHILGLAEGLGLRRT